MYDNDFYLSTTYPPTLGSGDVPISVFQRASMALMHVAIQAPRLVCLIRHAVSNPDDASALVAAVSHAETLWQIDLPSHMAEQFDASITTVPTPVDPELEDILPNSLEFDTVQSMNLCTRYWNLRIVLCGLTGTLHRHFPVECSLSLLPSPASLRAIDIDSALQMAKSLPWAMAISAKLPLVPLRLHNSLGISVAPWNRIIRDSTLAGPSDDVDTDLDRNFEISRAHRMKTWVFYHCDLINKSWNVSGVEEEPMLEALDAMAGEPIPEWLPIRVRFEAEDGEMVIKLDYENHKGNYQERYEMGDAFPKKMLDPATQSERWQGEEMGIQEIPYRPANQEAMANISNSKNPVAAVPQNQTSNVRPVDFIHRSGRNLCSTSGWWPDSPNTATMSLDSTHQESGFLQPYRAPTRFGPASPFENNDRHPCLASSWWPQTPSTVTPSNTTSGRTPQAFSTPSQLSANSPESSDVDSNQQTADDISTSWSAGSWVFFNAG